LALLLLLIQETQNMPQIKLNPIRGLQLRHTIVN